MSDILHEPTSPGSYMEYAARQVREVAFREYAEVLADYRRRLAEAKGITVEQLHHGGLNVGRLATKSEIPPPGTI